MAFPDDPLVVTVEAAFGADRTADPGTWAWADITSRWHPDEPLTIRTGRRENARHAEAGSISITCKNTDGQLTPEDPRSQWWPHVDEGLPIRATLDPGAGDPLVFGGFVASITPRWPGGSAGQSLVDVVAGGVIRQHARGQSPIRSALERLYVQSGPLGVWPLDDPDGSRVSRAVVGSPMRPASAPPPLTESNLPGYGQGQIAPWLTPGIKCATEAGTITAPVTGATTGDGFTVGVMYRADQSTTGTPPIATAIIIHAADDLQFRFLWGADEGTIAVAVFQGPTIVDSDQVSDDTPLLDGQPHVIQVQLLDVQGLPGEVAANFRVDGQVVLSVLLDIFATGLESLPIPDALSLSWNGETSATTQVQFGMLAAFDSFGFPGNQELLTAAFGHQGEPAVVRAQRVCDEEGVPLTVVGDPADSELMGPQPPTTLLELLRECERTDDGILAERQFAFWLRTRTSRYNQDPTLVVDAAARQLGRQFEPVRDDQRARNEWTISQAIGGGQVTVRDEADQQRRGRKDDSLEVNLASPARLVDRAIWELARSTVRQLRYPRLTVHLHSSPALLEQVMAVRLGDRVQVVNPPAQHPPGPVDQAVEGILHTVRGRRAWTWEAVVAPYAPWQVGVWAGDSEIPAADAPQRYDTAGSELAATVQSGVDTQLEVWPVLGPGWVCEPGDQYDIALAGARLRVTAAAGEPDRLPARGDGQASTAQATSLVAPTVTAQAGNSLLVCSWITGEFAFADNLTPPGGMTPGAETDATATTMRAAWQAITTPGATGTRTATATVADHWAAISLLIRGTSGTPVVEEELATVLELGAHNNPATLTTAPGTQAGWWLLAIRSDASIEQLTYDPAAEVPSGDGWVEITTSRTRSTSRPYLRAWVRYLKAGGATDVTFPPTTSGDEVHLRVIVLSGTSAQTLTVQQQPVNGVTKTIPAGERLALWAPARYAL